jgi:hypothetical protein
MKLISELSRGLPRRVNVLCDRTLQEGRAVSATVISSELVKRAAKSLAGVHPPPTEGGEPIAVVEEGTTIAIDSSRQPQRSRFLGIAGGVAVALLLIAGFGYWYFAGQILDDSANFAMPPRAQVPTMAPGKPGPVPTDAELEAYFREMARGIGGGGGGLSQLPHDRHELN